ncbi:MAG: hypothetical protein WC389_15150 [Lutibacter sp.]|jgi:uncharacterized BrkB/YihY/UPF0761 family membrane protein
MKKVLDISLSILLVLAYVFFRMQVTDKNTNDDIFFLLTSIGLGYFIGRCAKNVDRVGFIIVVYSASFFYCLAILFLYYWILFNDPAVWVYKALIWAVFLSAVLMIIKKIKK